MTDEQPEQWAEDFAQALHGAGLLTGPASLDIVALYAQRAFAEREEHARAERRNIISHATMGSTTGEGLSVNDVCVEISRQRNKLYQAGKASAEAELVGAIKWAGEVAPPVDHNGCVTVDMTLEQLNAMRTLAGFRALKSREAGHG
ncbi:hypothetical protein [Novosphingobium sp. MMS21-SN21R]|uniref:hypothetical protein n=1 Tax=Novosphingobium sp. MMS21-SN21R TaxID=2969298 RepID=UPI002887E4F9|nr:hypothetical protein [Novosphingobium sp. MMS21-SN21R]MDT0507551.1 hypothetical protein [Novosphingobium sp. MMS21-SN21R]MDT0509514.1 hypothetical protein [Novosphingobium sp. MMS21-SN21R]